MVQSFDGMTKDLARFEKAGGHDNAQQNLAFFHQTRTGLAKTFNQIPPFAVRLRVVALVPRSG